MANPANTSQSNGGGIGTRYSAVIYDQYKTHGSNFFLLLANSLAKYEDDGDTADNSAKCAKGKVTKRNRYAAVEGTNEAQYLELDHGESWRKYLEIFGSNVKRSNAIAKKYIKRGKRYAMGHKYISKIIQRQRSDLFIVFNAGKSDSQTKSRGDTKVALQEREWFETQFSRQMGEAPELADEVIVLESLMKKAKWRYVRASKYFTNRIVLDPKTVTTMTWGSAPKMIKCTCPVKDCICLGNTLLPPKSIPRGSCLYWFPRLQRLMMRCPCTRRRPKGALVPALIQSASVEQKLYILLEERNLLEKLGPEMCLYGCRNFFFFDRTNYSMARMQKKNELRQAIINGTDSPLRTDTILEGLKEEDPRVGETGESEDIDGSQSAEEEENEMEEEMLPRSDRVCDYRGKCHVSSQVERGADGEFEISFPYDIMFPRAMRNISGTKLDVCSIYTGLKSGAARLENLIPIQSMKRRWYDKWKKEFYLSVFQYPEKEQVCSVETKETQTVEELKSCLVKALKNTNETKQKEEAESTSGVKPKFVKCNCDVTPKGSRILNVSCVASQQSLRESFRTPSTTKHTSDQIPKAEPEPAPILTSDAASASPDTISIQKGSTEKDSLMIQKNGKGTTGKPLKVPKKTWTPTSSAPNNDTPPISKTPPRPQKSVSLDAGPKPVKTGFFSRRSKKTIETKKESKTHRVSKPNEETMQVKTVKSILRSSNIITVNTSDLNLEKQSRDESSREHIIREILFEPQALPQNTKRQSKTSFLLKEREKEEQRESVSAEPTGKNTVDAKELNAETTQSNASHSKAVPRIATEK